MSVGIANFQTLYQTLYPETDLPYLIPKNLPLLHAVPKQDGLSGDVIDAPFLYGPKQGYSQDFNAAQVSAGTAPRATRAALRCSQAYHIVEFQDKDLVLSQGEAAYADLFEKTVTGIMQDFYNNFDLDLHGSGYGWRGTVQVAAGGTNTVTGATLASNQIQVATTFALEAVFNQDEMVQAALFSSFTPPAGSIFPPPDGRAPSSVSSPVQITAVDPISRTLTLSDATAFTAGAFVCQSGCVLGFTSTTLNPAFIGLDSWNPYGGVTTTDAFNGINRSVAPTKLGGYWYDGSRLSIEDAVKRLSARMSEGGASEANLCLMNPMDMDALDSKLGSSVRYASFNTATYGFDSIMINGAAGRMDVVADPHMAQGYARLVTPSSWVLHHKNALPHMVELGGRNVEQGLNFDGRTARLRMYAQLRCVAPHKNGIVRLPSVLV